MALLKKVLLSVASVVSLGVVGNSFAEPGKNIDTAVTVTDVNTAAQALVKAIIADTDNNHPVKSIYDNLSIAPLVQTDYAGTFDTDSNNHLTHITISSVSFNASNVPVVGTYPAVISLDAYISADCKVTTTPTAPVYKLVKGDGTVIDSLFQKDLNSYAHVVFDSLLATSGLNAYCAK